MQKILQYFLFLFVLVIFGTGIYFFRNTKSAETASAIKSFEDCEKAGFPILESYPRQCLDSSGNHFTETTENSTQSGNSEIMKDKIILENIKDGNEISSPVKILGKARGMWFFEGSFPVFVLDSSEQVIGQGIATAKGEWMTENFVTFESEIKYTLSASSTTKTGFLILQKDNPSGMPENDEELKIPVLFK